MIGGMIGRMHHVVLGAVELDGENVYADPAGHPFCLIPRPRWAPPIPEDS
jgi:hypothetical protein